VLVAVRYAGRVEDSNQHIIEEIVRQVVYLQELYADARSEKYKKIFWRILLPYCPS
jgi:hypothetical protein